MADPVVEDIVMIRLECEDRQHKSRAQSPKWEKLEKLEMLVHDEEVKEGEPSYDIGESRAAEVDCKQGMFGNLNQSFGR